MVVVVVVMVMVVGGNRRLRDGAPSNYIFGTHFVLPVFFQCYAFFRFGYMKFPPPGGGEYVGFC
jgi:hypothetical protein